MVATSLSSWCSDGRSEERERDGEEDKNGGEANSHEHLKPVALEGSQHLHRQK